MGRKWSTARGHEPTADLGGRCFYFLFFQKIIKLHEMTGNDQKSVWEYHLGAKALHFGDFGCPGRYYGVLEGDFHVDSHNYGCEIVENLYFF